MMYRKADLKRAEEEISRKRVLVLRVTNGAAASCTQPADAGDVVSITSAIVCETARLGSPDDSG